MSGQENLVLLAGILIGYILKPFLESISKTLGEGVGGLVVARKLEHERARGRQPVDVENENIKADLTQTGNLRLAAMDKRLQAHQDAYFLWTKLYGAMHTNELMGIVLECQAWWNQNCLFLEETVREDFSVAVFSASTHDNLIRMSQGDFSAKSGVDENWARILKPSTTIQRAMALPAIAPNIDGKKEKPATPAKGN
jgi:hypothetical protein